MSHTFDATLKKLVQARPEDWLVNVGAHPDEPVEVLNPDLSTVSRFADAVLRVGRKRIVHYDFQAGYDPVLPRRVLLYNALLYHLYGQPVHSVVLLLRPGAGGRNTDGCVEYEAFTQGRLEFHYEVIRVWERPVVEWLCGPLGMVPLAILGQLPLGSVRGDALVEVVERVAERLERDATPELARELMFDTYLLTGLRVPKTRLDSLFERVSVMNESSTFQHVLDMGAIRQARKMVLALGARKFGKATSDIESAVNAIDSLRRLNRLNNRVIEVDSWDDLLKTK